MTGKLQHFSEGYPFFFFFPAHQKIFLPLQSYCLKPSNLTLQSQYCCLYSSTLAENKVPSSEANLLVSLELFFLPWRNVSCIWLLYLYLNSQLLPDLHVHIHIFICKIYTEHVLCINMQHKIQTFIKNKMCFFSKNIWAPNINSITTLYWGTFFSCVE